MRYDVAVIGGGPGGYVAAIRMGQLGLKVALIEEGELGGVCLNRGCIPTKALYSATKLLERATDAKAMGIEFTAPVIDLEKLASWKDGVISTLVGGISSLLKANGVTVYQARGRLDGTGRVALSTAETVDAERIMLATGSSPIEIPGFSFADPYVWSSDDALDLTEIPERLVVIGGGVIGLEIATIYNRLGSAVTILEMMPEILPGIDLDRRTIVTLKRALKAQGITVRVNTAAKSIEETSEGPVVQIADGDTVAADRILLAVGRRPNSTDIGLETVG
ncbi:FAD-dependent oxidoreductase, partial [Candidatus Bipolaricaulota bacterium]|nr:FAD-dependent oxidoreductase [Candidatus Bipolaricaulota bacterium]